MFLAALTAIIALALFIVIFDPSLPSQVLSMIRKIGGIYPLVTVHNFSRTAWELP
jgi:hypothetical protein